MGYYPEYYGPALYELNFAWGRQSSHLIVDAVRRYVKPGDRILDVGTGTGNPALEIASLFPESRVVGLDLEENALILARYRAERDGVRNAIFQKGDATCLDSGDGSFDLVVASQIFGDQEKIVSQMVRVLRPGGIIAFARPHSTGSRLMAWCGETLREFAALHGRSLPAELTERSPEKAATVLETLVRRLGVEPMRVAETDAPEGMSWSSFMLSYCIHEGLDSLRTRLATILQVDPGDRAALTPAFYDFFRIGKENLEATGRGALLSTTFLLVVGRKTG